MSSLRCDVDIGPMILTSDMAVIEGNYIHFREHGETLLFHLHQLYTFNMFLDACLVCNGTEIFAHKAVLAAASPILRERLHEFGDCHHVRIEIEQEIFNMNVNADDIKMLIEFIYKGEVCVPQPRLSLFLELGNQFQISGLYKQPATNIGYPLSLLSQPLSNCGLNQLGFSTQDSTTYQDTFDAQNRYEENYYSNGLLHSEKYSDRPSNIKPDRGVSMGNSTYHNMESNMLFSDRIVEQNNDDSNSKFLYDFPNLLHSESYAEPLPAHNLQTSSEFTESCLQIQSDNTKDMPVSEGHISSSSGAEDTEILFSNLTNHPNSFFASSDYDPTNSSTDSCLHDVNFQSCKIQTSTILPERHIRLKVKDSIGGVSLQDTSRCDITAVLDLQVESSCSNHSVELSTDSANNQVQIRDAGCASQSLENVENICPKCPEKFVSLDDLAVHLWESHKIGKIQQCLLCSFTCFLERKMVEHGKSHLKSPDTRQCCICAKKFKTRATLRNHLACHASNKWFKCSKCSAHYSQRNSLLRHLASEHKLDTEGCPLKGPLTCPECTFETWTSRNLHEHRSRCHAEDKPYKCSECSYSSTDKTALSKHVRTHTQERPFICDSCGLSFTTVSTLRRHSRSHTKEKPYRCKECGHQYADKKRLHDHQLRHKNIKPFNCHFCDYSCRRKDNLQSHIKRTHLEGKVKETLTGYDPSAKYTKADQNEVTFNSLLLTN